MKQKDTFLILIIFALFLPALSLQAQSSSQYGINYQAVARTASGDLLSETELLIDITFLHEDSDEVVYEEQHTVLTSDLGLFSLVIGGDDATWIGGTASSLEAIDWESANLYLKVSVDAGSGLETLGISRIESVPYALYALNSGDESQDLSFSNGSLALSDDPTPDVIDLGSYIRTTTGWEKNADTVSYLGSVSVGSKNPYKSTLAVQGTSDLLEDPLFVVRRKDGQPVFAVYNEGVWVFVDETLKGTKGGFAVGGYNSTKGSPGQEYMRVTPDSVRIYINDDITGKAVKGGFAVGGYNSSSKGTSREFLRVTDDSTRIYVDDPAVKGVKGGFAVGGYNSSQKALPSSFLTMTPDNYFIGEGSGSNNTTGFNNMFFGYQAGLSNTTGKRNIFIGEESGALNLYGYNNVFLGYLAGKANTGTTYSDQGSNNVYIGTYSGQNCALGVANTFVGANSGYTTTSSIKNTFIGTHAGYAATNGSENTFIGYYAGRGTTSGDGNVCIGNEAGSNLSTGYNNILIGQYAGQSVLYGYTNLLVGTYAGQYIRETKNTVIGHYAGYNLRYSSGNVMLGYQAGYSETGSNKLYIANTSTANPLLYGDFSTGALKINGNLATNYTPTSGYGLIVDTPSSQTESYALWVRGNTYVSGTVYESSDKNLKSDIRALTTPIENLKQINGVSFTWTDTKQADSGRQLGVLAQDVKLVYPELVREDHEGHLAVNYTGLIPVLVEAVKTQQEKIELLEEQNKSLESSNEALKNELDEIRSMLLKLMEK